LLVGQVATSKVTFGLRSPRLLGEDIAMRIDLHGDRIDLRADRLTERQHLEGVAVPLAQWELEDVNLDFKGQTCSSTTPPGFKTTSELAVCKSAHAAGPSR
jgi:hypothetical protein